MRGALAVDIGQAPLVFSGVTDFFLNADEGSGSCPQKDVHNIVCAATC